MGNDLRAEALLSQALNLAVRARKMDEQEKAAAVAANRGGFMDRIISRSGSVQAWVQDQYERDLVAWESAARQYLGTRS